MTFMLNDFFRVCLHVMSFLKNKITSYLLFYCESMYLIYATFSFVATCYVFSK